MITVTTTGVYEQNFASLVHVDPNLSSLVDKAVNRFKNNPADTRIHVHALRGHLLNRWAIEVTDDIRIIFKWIGKQHARFLTIGPHEYVYPGYRKTPASKLNDE